MKRRYAFFRFQPSDCRAAEAWLEGWKARGWELEKIIWPWLAVFLPLEHTQVRYAAERMEGDEGQIETYLTLCADAGWEKVGETGGLFLFKSAPGQNPAPLQTDRSLEEEHLQKAAVRPMISAALTPILAMGINAALRWGMGGAAYWFEVFLDPRAMALLGLLAALVGWNLYLAFHAWRYGRACRRARTRGEQMPVPGVTGALLRGRLDWVIWTALLLVLLRSMGNSGPRREVPLERAALEMEGRPLVTAACLGGRDSPGDVLWMEEGPFVRKLELIQTMGGDGLLWSERYDARWPWLAEDIFQELSDKADRDQTRKVICGAGEGAALRLEPPEGVEAILLRYERGDCLVLRGGTTVARLAADLDFTDEDILDTIVSQLNLGA